MIVERYSACAIFSAMAMERFCPSLAYFAADLPFSRRTQVVAVRAEER